MLLILTGCDLGGGFGGGGGSGGGGGWVLCLPSVIRLLYNTYPLSSVQVHVSQLHLGRDVGGLA